MKTLPLSLVVLAVAAGARGDIDPPGLPPAPTAAQAAVETIEERDSAGRVRVRRDVRQNDRGDYVNHGAWRAWDDAGELIGQGRYHDGRPEGVWSRWADAEDAPLLATPPLGGFAGPFLSQATYRNGRLEGDWSIFDADGRLASTVRFRDGRRDGEAVLYTPDGEVFRRSRFLAGVPVGVVEERGESGLQSTAEYVAGRRRSARVERFASGVIKSRDGWLGPAATQSVQDDPWRVRLAEFAEVGESLRDGPREEWWPNGQRKLTAEYALGKAVGEARWWHANGQLALRGAYADGLASGEWAWWRVDGVRAAGQTYVAGRPAANGSIMAGGRAAADLPRAQVAGLPSAATPR